jgi:hypothetical protein
MLTTAAHRIATVPARGTLPLGAYSGAARGHAAPLPLSGGAALASRSTDPAGASISLLPCPQGTLPLGASSTTVAHLIATVPVRGTLPLGAYSGAAQGHCQHHCRCTIPRQPSRRRALRDWLKGPLPVVSCDYWYLADCEHTDDGACALRGHLPYALLALSLHYI